MGLGIFDRGGGGGGGGRGLIINYQYLKEEIYANLLSLKGWFLHEGKGGGNIETKHTL